MVLRETGQQLAWLRPRDGETEHLGAERAEGNAGRRQMRFEPAQVVLLGNAGAEHEKPPTASIGDGEIADELAGVVEHWRKRQPALARETVREHQRKPCAGVGSRDLVLGEARRLA